MQETRRQAYLRAMGLTPWVARQGLPGAAASQPLDWPVPEPETPTPEVERKLEVPAAPDAPAPRPADPQPVAEKREQAPAEQAVWRFTLHAMATPTVMLVVQQARADAPEPGREEQRMLAGLLRYLNARQSRPRPFAWPLPGMEDKSGQAGESLEAFLLHLCNDSGCERVLWLVDDELARRLLGVERFRPFKWAGLDGLTVASLEEMFTNPEAGKRRSWQAMVKHGFTA